MKKCLFSFVLLLFCNLTVLYAQAPSLATIANKSTCDGQSINNIALNLSGGTTGLTYSFTGSNSSITPNITFGGTATMPTFTIATIPGQVGVTTITITATNTSGSDSESFQLVLGNITQGTPVLGPETVVISPFNNLSSVVFGPDGNLYTTVGNVPGAPYTQGSIAQFSPTGTLLNANYITGLTSHGRLKLGKDGKFYFINNGQTNLTRYNGQTFEATKTNAAVSVFGVSTNAAGEVFYLNYAGGGGVLKLPTNFTNASTITNLYTTNPNPGFLVIDPTDTFLYYLEDPGLNTSKLIRLNADGSGGFTQILQTPGLRALSFDESGQLWISHANEGKLSKVNITSGEITDVITSGFYYEPIFKNGDLFYRVASGSTAGVRKRALTIPTTYTTCNYPPTIDAIANQATCQNSPKQVSITINDIDMNNVTITATSSNQILVPTANLSVSGNLLSITPALNQSGSTVITLRPNDGLVNGTAVTFTFNVIATPSAPIASNQAYCGEKQIRTIEVTIDNGNFVRWYDVPTGGTILNSNVSLTSSTTLYVSQFNLQSGCESARTAVTVSIIPTSENITTISACNSYTWNGTNYTDSGIYTGSTTNCVTEKLDLTINATPSAPIVGGPLSNVINVSGSACVQFNVQYEEFGTENGERRYKGIGENVGIAYDEDAWYFFNYFNDNFNQRSPAFLNYTTPAENYPPTTGWIGVNDCGGDVLIKFAYTQSFCAGATVANLAATGTNLQWYDVASGGTALSSTTALITGTYYVSQTLNGCESARVAVAVTILSAIATPNVSNQTFCVNNNPTVANLSASSNVLPFTGFVWYSSLIGGTPLSSSTPLTTGLYYVAVTNENCESLRNTCSVTVTPPQTLNLNVLDQSNTSRGVTIITQNPVWQSFTAQKSGLLKSITIQSPIAALGTSMTLKVYEGTGTTGNLLGQNASPTINPVSTIFSSTFDLTNIKVVAGNTYTFEVIKNSSDSNQWLNVTSGNSYSLGQSNVINGSSHRDLFFRTFVDQSTQSFCAGATLANLISSISSAYTIKCYNVETGGSELATSTVLLSGTYYASQITDGCEGTRVPIQVTIYPSTVNTIVAKCDSYTWLVNGATYTNSGTYTFTNTNANGCTNVETLNLTITPSITPTFAQVATICSGEALAALPTTSIEGITGTWSPELDNTNTTTYTFTPDAGQCALTTTMTIYVQGAVSISGGDVTVCAVGTALNSNGISTGFTNSTTLTVNNVLPGSTVVWERTTNFNSSTPTWLTAENASTTYNNVVINGNVLTVSNLSTSIWYRAKITNGTCVTNAAPVKITVNPVARVGNITSPVSYCVGVDNSISFALSSFTGSSIAWELSTTSPTSGFQTVAGQNGTNFTMNNLNYPLLSKFYVRAVVTSGNCTTAISSVRTVTINPVSVAGTITGGGTFCSGSNTIMRITGQTGKIQWMYSNDGTNFFNVPTGSATAPSFGTLSTYGYVSSYSITNLTATTYFKARVSSGTCSFADSNVIAFVVATAPTAGNATAAMNTVCTGEGTTITLSDYTGAVRWQKSTNWTAAKPTWTTIAGVTLPTLATGALNVATAFRAYTSIGVCSPAAFSNVVPININCIEFKTIETSSSIEKPNFDVKAYPNPSNNVFNFKIDGANDEAISILVFDMLGKQIENKVVKANDIENISLGQYYSRGIYNVIVSQGLETKTLRVIKN